MKNELKIESDSNNIYTEFNLKASKAGKIILAIMIFVIFGLLIGLILNSKPKDIKGMIIPIIFIITLLGFCIKYLLWNIYGQEFIVINPKSISYKRNYGFFNTNLTSIIFDELSILPLVIDMKDLDEPIGKLQFFNIDKDTKLSEIKFESTIVIPINELKKLISQISLLNQSETMRTKGFYGNSLN